MPRSSVDATLAFVLGLYCYKLVIDGVWSFDPDNPERAFCGGIENSLLCVSDHALNRQNSRGP